MKVQLIEMIKYFTRIILVLLFLQGMPIVAFPQQSIQTVAPGVKKLTSGTPERFSLYSFCSAMPLTTAMATLPQARLPFDINDIKITTSERGVVVEFGTSGNSKHL